MYEKNKSQRITLRLTEEQFNFTKMNADILGVSPSDFLRMVINSAMATTKAYEVNRSERFRKEGAGRENDKANQHNLV